MNAENLLGILTAEQTNTNSGQNYKIAKFWKDQLKVKILKKYSENLTKLILNTS